MTGDFLMVMISEESAVKLTLSPCSLSGIILIEYLLRFLAQLDELYQKN